jgi:hypothetical protein
MCDQLREKFVEWKEWLLGDDVHSVRNQIHNMMWDSAVYQSINEGRRYATTDGRGQIELNAMVHHFIDRGFFDLQMMAIRRLLDRETTTGERSVTSLWRLLDDVETHVALLTRESMLASLDLPYDYEKTREQVPRPYENVSGVKIMGDDYKQCYLSECAHRCVDALADVSGSQRRPGDVVQAVVIQWLKQRVAKCEVIHKYVNKFLAHSATPESRARLMDEETKITLGQILRAHEIICQTAEFVGQNIFLRSIGNPLSFPPFNQFEHFEKPWLSKKALSKLHEWWRGYDLSTREWLKWDWQSEYTAYSGSGGR